jgi:hypothetical protein
VNQGPPPDRRVPAEAIGLGLNVVVAAFLFGFLGHWIGKRVGADEALTLVGGLVGATAGFVSLYLHLARRSQDNRETKSE